MKLLLVMTVIGADRPGLVETISGLVAQHGGNWLDSRMARLGGQFAGILRVEIPTDRESVLASAMKALEAQGLAVVVQSDRSSAVDTDTAIVVVEIVGQDRPGIVHQISHALARHGVNVEELNTECSSAAMSGEPIFKARIKLKVPGTCDLAGLRKELERIAGDLIVDLAFKTPAEIANPESGQ